MPPLSSLEVSQGSFLPSFGRWQVPASALSGQIRKPAGGAYQPFQGGAEEPPWAELTGNVSGSHTGRHDDIEKDWLQRGF